MSKTYIYERADDGLFYRDPTIRGDFDGRSWVLCFDDEDQPELYFEHRADETPSNAERWLHTLLTHLNIHAAAMHHCRCGRCYGHIRDIRDSRSFFLLLDAPIPAALFVAAGHVGTSLARS